MSEIMPEPTASAYPPEPEAEAESGWSLSREEWDQLQQQQQALIDFVSSQPRIVMPGQQQEGQEGQFTYDPFDENSMRQMIRSEMAPLQQYFQQQREEGVEEWMREGLGKLAETGGEFDIDMARLRVDSLVNQLMPKYQDLWRATEAAMEQAAAEQRAYEQKFIEKAVAQHTNQLATLAGAPHEPGSTYTVGTQERVLPDYRKGGTVTSRFFGPHAER